MSNNLPATFAVAKRDKAVSFVVRLIRLDDSGAPLLDQAVLLEEGSTVFGRGPVFNITDQRVR